MPKLPEPPGDDAVGRVDPVLRTLAQGTMLARVYFTGGSYPTAWDEFRRYGPTNARFDHHLASALGAPEVQARSILYCATAAHTCFAEVFQETRRINRTRYGPWLAIFVLTRDVRLLDLTGRYPTRVGASMAINTGHRGRARAWARTFYSAYPALEGIYYPSSMNGNEPAVALNDRAEQAGSLPSYPEFNRALADDVLLDVLKHSAHGLGYGLL